MMVEAASSLEINCEVTGKSEGEAWPSPVLTNTSVDCTAVTDESGSRSTELVETAIGEDSETLSLTAAVMLIEALISSSTLELRGKSVAVETEYTVSDGKLTTVEAPS